MNDDERILNSIKEMLSRDKIQLWQSPYYDNETGSSEQHLQELSSRVCERVHIPEERVLETLKNLQAKALSNLKERDHYLQTGEATLKIRSPLIADNKNLTIKLEQKGRELKEAVSNLLQISSNCFKLICKGKVLQDEPSLKDQCVKNGFMIMVVQVAANAQNEIAAFESNSAFLDSTKKDVKFLTGKRNRAQEHFLQITDQNGKRISLPAAEKDALILAMTLHEKGRAEMKKEQFSLALIFLLEAEEEFHRCKSSLLERVDNYGLLNLDIAWCYLCLQSLNQLPNAEERLKKCQTSFEKSYGVNFDRLIALKGSSGTEAALLVRLHLLQAIVLYHQNNFKAARELIQKVGTEIRELKVDDEKVSQLVDLGYTPIEARLALRESKGDVSIAVSIIENKRVEKEKVREEENNQAKLEREKRKLGKCKNGHWVEPSLHQALISMGYTSDAAKWALSQTNNDISASIALIEDHPDQVPYKPSEELVEQVLGLGFSRDMAEIALRQFRGNFALAVEHLVSDPNFFNLENLPPLPESPPSTSTSTSSSSGSREEREEAFKRLAQGIASDEEDYLDLTLQAEEVFLKMYQDYLSKQSD